MECVCAADEHEVTVFVAQAALLSQRCMFVTCPVLSESARQPRRAPTRRLVLSGLRAEVRACVGTRLEGGECAAVVGLSDGHLVCVGRSARALAVQRPHTSAIQGMKVARDHTGHAFLLVLHADNVLVSVSWEALLGVLSSRLAAKRDRRPDDGEDDDGEGDNEEDDDEEDPVSQPALALPPDLLPRDKWRLDSQRVVNDVTLWHSHLPAPRLLRADVSGALLPVAAPKAATPKAAGQGTPPSERSPCSYVAVGEEPMLAMYPVYPKALSARDVVSAVASSVKAYAWSWLFGAKQAEPPKAVEPREEGEGSEGEGEGEEGKGEREGQREGEADPGMAWRLRRHSSLEDRRRVVARVVSESESGSLSRFAALCDGFGRVTLVDCPQCVAVRMWKGYRDAECCFCELAPRDKDGRPRPPQRFLVIHLPRRGLVEVWRLVHGERVWAATTHQLLLQKGEGGTPADVAPSSSGGGGGGPGRACVAPRLFGCPGHPSRFILVEALGAGAVVVDVERLLLGAN